MLVVGCWLLVVGCSEDAMSVCMSTAPQSLNGRASTPKSRPKKCRAEQRKTIRHHATQPMKLVERSPVFPNANRAEQTATEASTGHTSPFKPNGEATLQETSLPPRRKCVNSSKVTRVLTQNMYPVLYQALHPRRKVISRRIQLSYSYATPRHPEQ